MKIDTFIHTHNRLGVALEVNVLEEHTDASDESTARSRSTNGFSLLSTSLLCRLISSRTIDKADLQESSSWNARIHLPSTNGFVFNFDGVPCLAGSRKGNVDGRILKCSHLECFSSILG